MDEKASISILTSKKIRWTQFICSLIVIMDHSLDYLGFGNSKMSLFDIRIGTVIYVA